MNFKITVLGALLIASLAARSQQSVLFTSTLDAGAVSAKGSGNALRGSIGESFSGLVTRGGGALSQNGFFSFLALGGYVTSAGEAESPVPSAFFLWQNYPNPFNPSTTIRYSLPHKSAVQLSVYNALGQQISVLQDGEQDAGNHEVKFDASRLSSGVYFYKIEAGSFVQTRKLLLLK